jgi:hypothetical protein
MIDLRRTVVDRERKRKSKKKKRKESLSRQ